MKQRIIGRINGAFYEVVYPDGTITSRYPIEEARNNSKLKSAIERNGWEGL